MAGSDLTRLEGLRRQLEDRGIRFASSQSYLVYSLTGFSEGLIDLGKSRPDVELVDLGRLYQGE